MRWESCLSIPTSLRHIGIELRHWVASTIYRQADCLKKFVKVRTVGGAASENILNIGYLPFGSGRTLKFQIEGGEDTQNRFYFCCWITVLDLGDGFLAEPRFFTKSRLAPTQFLAGAPNQIAELSGRAYKFHCAFMFP